MITTNKSGTLKQLVQGLETNAIKGIYHLYTYQGTPGSGYVYFTIDLPEPLLDMKLIFTSAYRYELFDSSISGIKTILAYPTIAWNANARVYSKALVTMPTQFGLPSDTKGVEVKGAMISGFSGSNYMNAIILTLI